MRHPVLRSVPAAVLLVLLGATPGGSQTSSTLAPAAAAATVTPDSGLRDLEPVTVSGSGFQAGATINVVQCNLTNGEAGGVCYAATRTEASADGSGAFSTGFVVRRVINQTSATVDCAAVACGVAISDGTTSVFPPLAFDATIPANRPAVTVTPATALGDGATIGVAAAGFVPGAPLRVAQCAATSIGLERCDAAHAIDAAADADGTATASYVVRATIGINAPGGGPLSCLPTPEVAAPCAIIVANSLGASEFGAAPISFAAPTDLPRTGRSPARPAATGAALIGGGLAMLAAARRRARSA